jgi:hypothetical protein
VGCDNRLEGPFPGSGFRLPVPFLLEIDFLLFGSEDVPPLLLDFGILEKNKYRVKLGFNKLNYNKPLVITNIFLNIFCPRSMFTTLFNLVTKNSGYRKQTNLAGPKLVCYNQV